MDRFYCFVFTLAYSTWSPARLTLSLTCHPRLRQLEKTQILIANYKCSFHKTLPSFAMGERGSELAIRATAFLSKNWIRRYVEEVIRQLQKYKKCCRNVKRLLFTNASSREVFCELNNPCWGRGCTSCVPYNTFKL